MAALLSAAALLTVPNVPVASAAGGGGMGAGPAKPASAPTRARAARAATTPAAPTRALAWTARLVATTPVLAAPRTGARVLRRLAPVAAWNGGEVRLLVLETRRREQRTWLRVALPTRPNGASGWVDADAVQLSSTRWRIEVDLRTRRLTVLRDARRVRRWTVVIGAPATPTPRGLFAVYERVDQPPGSELGPWALHITGHSDVLDDYGGGPGRVALHGRAGALLADPLGSAASHGCVRMNSADVSWLAARADPGTPVEIR